MQRRMRHPVRVRLLLRILLLGVAFPAVYLGGASAAFYYRERLVNESVDIHKLPQLQHPDSSTRLMVFAPHCDDETLGCAGLIQQTLAAGGHVETVIITNGDGYPAAVERQERVLRARPKDYIRFAALRQGESKNAMTSLGIQGNHTLFLGYPDQGLTSLWNSNWNEDKPYSSRFTECSKSPYAETFNTESVYCGVDLLRDLRSAMVLFRPTLIVVSHPAEDHPDHAAAANFVTLALQQLKHDRTNEIWSSGAKLYHYLVHRGDWPTPQGNKPDLPLTPPAAMMSVDTDWSSLPLSALQVKKKAVEIAAYPSQTSIMPAFLSAFARKNELFGSISLHNLPVVKDGAIQVDDSEQDWTGMSPCIDDPGRDNVLRDLQGGGDLLAIYCARDSTKLYLRLKMRCEVSTRFRYTVRVRPFGPDWKSTDSDLQLELTPGRKHAASDGTVCTSYGTNIEASIPWTMVNGNWDSDAIRAIAVSAETWLSTVQIDRTETRLLSIPSVSPPAVSAPGSTRTSPKSRLGN